MMKKRKFGAGGPAKRPTPTPADRAAARAQDEMLKKVKVTKREADTLASANRSEGGTHKKGGMIKKRYADGGMSGAAIDLEAAARRGENLRELDRMDTSVSKVEAPAKKQSFGAAFAAARKKALAGGPDTFKWMGKSYGTQMKGGDTKSTKTTPPMSVAGEDKEIVVTGRRNQTPAPAKPAAGKPMRVGSESSSAAKTNLREGLRQGARASERAIKTVASGVKDAPSQAAAALESANEQTKTQSRNMAKLREKNPDLITQILRASDPNNKKGGAGYAKGGSVTRADGCAVRGKTKGKIC